MWGECGSCWLRQKPASPPAPVQCSTLLVADIEAAHERLAERGVAFPSVPHFIAAMPDHDLWLDEFRDPDGNPLALMCEKARAS